MANWLTAVGFWEDQAVRRVFSAWRAQGGDKVLKALAHWETQSGLGPAFRWWRRVVQHLREADQLAEGHRRHHACRAAFQASMQTVDLRVFDSCILPSSFSASMLLPSAQLGLGN